MSEADMPPENPYAVPLVVLERRSRVPAAGNITESSPTVDDSAAWARDEQRRQAQLAGGA